MSESLGVCWLTILFLGWLQVVGVLKVRGAVGSLFLGVGYLLSSEIPLRQAMVRGYWLNLRVVGSRGPCQ